MKYVQVGTSGLKVSPICLGAITFGNQVIDVEQAEDIRRDREASLQKIEKSMEPVPNSPQIDLQQLYEANLISGVVKDEVD